MAETKKVEISGFKYDPEIVVVNVGDSVEWTNGDGAAHTASRDDAPAFDTGLLRKDESATIVFDTASNSGGFEYFCRPHSFMKGTVVVVLKGTKLTAFSRAEAIASHHSPHGET